MLRMLVAQRQAVRMTQTALASQLGITQSEVSKFERGERDLHAFRLGRWLRILGLDLPPPDVPPNEVPDRDPKGRRRSEPGLSVRPEAAE